MQVKSIAECSYGSITSTFIKLPFVIKIFVLTIFEWQFYTYFTVYKLLCKHKNEDFSKNALLSRLNLNTLAVTVSHFVTNMNIYEDTSIMSIIPINLTEV